MAEEIGRPLAAAQKITMVSSGGSEVGAAKLTGEVLDIMTRLPQAVEKLTGVSISQVRTHNVTVCCIVIYFLQSDVMCKQDNSHVFKKLVCWYRKT